MTGSLPSKLNNEFRIFFVPKKPESRSKRYIPVGAYQLEKYIGGNNANTAILKALKCKEHKYSKTFRSTGTCIFYMK